MDRVFDITSNGPKRSQILVVGVVLSVAIAMGIASAHFGLQLRELAIVLLAIATLVLVLVPTDQLLFIGFGLWILTFGFGWRTVHLEGELSLHPSEVLAWMLFVVLIARSIARRTRLDWRTPIFIPILVGFSFVGILVGLINGIPTDVVIEESKVMLSLLPVYYIVRWILRTRLDWDRSTSLAIIVATYLACLGAIDFFFPEFSKTLTGSLVDNPGQLTTQGFERVLFSLYGSPIGATVIFMFLGFTVRQLMSVKSAFWIKVCLGGALLLQLFGIYISGYRVLAYSVVLFFVLYAFAQRRGWLLVLASAIVLPVLPIEFYQRFTSLVDTRFADSSQYKRLGRAEDALELIRQSPYFGHGWGASGYVHSDLIQIGANLGLIALVLFVLWLSSIIFRVFRLLKEHDEWIHGNAAVLIGSLCGVGLLLAGEGLIVFVQLMIPVWFLIGMAYKLIDISKARQSNFDS